MPQFLGLKKLKGPARDHIGRLYLDGSMTIAELSSRYDIRPRSIYKFASRIRNGLINHGNVGSPRAFDQEAEDRWVDSITKKRIKLDEQQSHTLVLQCLQETCEKRGVSYGKRQAMLSQKTIAKAEKRRGILTKNAEVGTKARINAVEDIRHMVSFAAMNKYAKDILPIKVINISIEYTLLILYIKQHI